MTSSSNQSQKEVVTSITTYSGHELRTATDPQTAKFVQKNYVTFICPKLGYLNPKATFLEKSGYHNHYRHVHACYGKEKRSSEQDKAILNLYHTTRENMTAKGDKEVRRFSKYDIKIGVSTLVETIFELVELVEKRIADGLSGTKGAILFDGCSCNNMHFKCVLASYCVNDKSEIKPLLTLLALSPMSKEDDTDDDSDEHGEATSFNAQAHVQFFTEIFCFFKQELQSWCLCLISDNCTTNLKVADISKNPYVRCGNHKLNLEVNMMMDDTVKLSNTIHTVHDTIVSARKLKNAALLCNLTDLRPITHNPKRWSGKLLMLQRFASIKDELMDVEQAENSNLELDTSARLLTKANKYSKMLTEIDTVTKSLQTRGYTFSECRFDLDELQKAVEDDRENHDSPLYNCRLGQKYISTDANIVRYPDFEKAVVKIQDGKYTDLNDVEKETAAILLKHSLIDNGSDEIQECISMTEKLAKRRKISESSNPFMTCDFIFGSVAEVERIWSIAKYILTENRRGMTPQLFEALMFLRLNERFWNEQLVSDALNMARSDAANKRLEEHEQHN